MGSGAHIPAEGLKRVFGDADVALLPEYVSRLEGPLYLAPEELDPSQLLGQSRQASATRNGRFIFRA